MGIGDSLKLTTEYFGEDGQVQSTLRTEVCAAAKVQSTLRTEVCTAAKVQLPHGLKYWIITILV